MNSLVKDSGRLHVDPSTSSDKNVVYSTSGAVDSPSDIANRPMNDLPGDIILLRQIRNIILKRSFMKTLVMDESELNN